MTNMPHVTALARTLRRQHPTRVWDVTASVSDGTSGDEIWLTTGTLESAHVALALASDTVQEAHEILAICLNRRPVKVHVELTVTDTGRPETVAVEASWRHGDLIWEPLPVSLGSCGCDHHGDHAACDPGVCGDQGCRG